MSGDWVIYEQVPSEEERMEFISGLIELVNIVSEECRSVHDTSILPDTVNLVEMFSKITA